MLLLTDWLTTALTVDGFGSALLGAIVISIVSWALSTFLPD
jgi:putative membrane protein